MKDDLHFLQLWDMYSPLLTATQREITDLYFNYDLSLGEIAEQKEVSRQSVSDCLQKCRKQLETYEEKLGFLKGITNLSREYSAYMTVVKRWMAAQREKNSTAEKDLAELETAMHEVWTEFAAEATDGADGGLVVGRGFREGR